MRITMTAVMVAAGLACGGARGEKPRPNFAYVQSGPDGVFYARCVPDGDAGPKGTTTVYRVGKERDEVVDRYDWYAGAGVVLGWSPVAGKVAVMALGDPPAPGSAAPAALSFHLGGKRLASYTTADLARMGVATGLASSDGRAHPRFKVVGCEQVPGTNDYRFVLDADGKPLAFDILTGRPPAG